MTSYLRCPNCNNLARFAEAVTLCDELYLRCDTCGKLTDDSELAAAQPPETCTEAAERMDREQPRSVICVTHGSAGGWGDMTPLMRAWVGAAFAHPERIEIERFEVHA